MAKGNLCFSISSGLVKEGAECQLKLKNHSVFEDVFKKEVIFLLFWPNSLFIFSYFLLLSGISLPISRLEPFLF